MKFPAVLSTIRVSLRASLCRLIVQRVPWLPQVVAKSFFRWTHESRNLSAWGDSSLGSDHYSNTFNILLTSATSWARPSHLQVRSTTDFWGSGWFSDRERPFSYKTSSELIVVTTSDSESPGYRVSISDNVIMVNCSFYWAIIPRLSVYFFSLFFSHNRSIFSWYKIFQTNGSNASIFSFTTPETSTQTTPIQTPKVNSEHVKINLKKEKRTRNMILVKGKTAQKSLN